MKYLGTDYEAKVILWVSVKTPGRVKVLFSLKKKKMVVLLLAPDCCFNWTDDKTGFNKDKTAFR